MEKATEATRSATEFRQDLAGQREGLHVISVFVKPCNWQVSPLGSIQGRPASGKALSTLPAAKADDELAKIAREILELVRWAKRAFENPEQVRRPGQAIADYSAAIALPDAPAERRADALLNRGLAHGQQRRPAKEIADYSAVIEMPDAPAKLRARARAYRAQRTSLLSALFD
jgi:hypothetical protein